MVKEIVHDPMFLRQKSTDATEDDKQIALDLLDTLRANLEHCVGMAANMIGVKKNIIAISVGLGQFVMINPVILKKSKPYDTEESCLSLLGGPRKCKRYEEIEVEYLDINWKKQRQKYSGWTAVPSDTIPVFSLGFAPGIRDVPWHSTSDFSVRTLG